MKNCISRLRIFYRLGFLDKNQIIDLRIIDNHLLKNRSFNIWSNEGEADERNQGPRKRPLNCFLCAKRRWLTPVLADLEQILHEVDGRWELLAQLVRELEELESTTGEKVRLRLAEFNRRASP